MPIRRLCLALLLSALALPARAETQLTVMTFNIWGGGVNAGKPVDETVAAIRAAGADIVGVQETRAEADPCTADSCPTAGPSAAVAIAKALGFHVYDQTAENPALWANAVISRWPIGPATPHDLGVTIDVDGRPVHVFNIHLPDAPYQPYQLLNIEYGPHPFIKTEAEAIAEARRARGAGIDLLLSEIAAVPAGEPVLVFGDFNEPSDKDWTEKAVAAGHQPVAVRYPSTAALEAAGLVDVFRTAFPDEVAKPAYTWTPTTAPDDPEDHHDRIDFIFARAPGLTVHSAAIVGEKSPEADIVVTPWPSDHRAVAAKIWF